MKFIISLILFASSIYPQDYILLIINTKNTPINCFMAATNQNESTHEWIPFFNAGGKVMIAKNFNLFIVLPYKPTQISFSITPVHEISIGEFSFQYKIEPKKPLEFLDVGNAEGKRKESLKIPEGTFSPAPVSEWRPPSKSYLKRLLKIVN